VLNCTPPRTSDPEAGVPNYFEKEKTFKYLRIPIFDNKGEDILLTHLPTAIKFIEEGKHYGSVLVHCHKGVSRSVSFVCGYLMRSCGMTLDEALSYVKV
jgi:protein-tyrosine phosphatase